MPGFDYSKWDNIVLSDDEEDHHPNIDPAMMRRLKKEQRERDNKEYYEKKSQYLADGSPEALEKLKVLEANKKWTTDELCYVASERTIINRGAASKDTTKKTKKQDGWAPKKYKNADDEEEAYTEFKEKHQSIILAFAKKSTVDATEKFLKDNLVLLDGNSTAFLLMHMLELEMKGETEKMMKMVGQYIILQNILDLAKQSRVPPHITMGPFFTRMKDDESLAKLKVESASFANTLKLRAQQKLKEKEEAEKKIQEAEAEIAELEAEQEVVLGPGGLNPIEVFNELPASMQEAFESKDTPKLIAALKELPIEKVQYYMKRCEDSGLWVPAKDDGDDAEAEVEAATAAVAEVDIQDEKE